MMGGGRAKILAPVLLGLVHFLTAWGSLALTRWSNGLASIWVADAIVLVFLLLTPRVRWTAACVAVVISGTLANYLGGAPDPLALLFGLTNAADPVAVAILLQLSKQTFDFERLGDLIRFTAAAAIVSLVSATVAAFAITLHSGGPFQFSLVAWFTSVFLGLVIITPILLIGVRDLRDRKVAARDVGNLVATLSVVLGVGLFVFLQTRWPLFFLLGPPVLFATFRLRAFGAAASTLLLAAIGTAVITIGLGPSTLAEVSFGERMALLQAFLAVTILTALSIAALLAERDRYARHMADGEARFRSVVDAVSDVIYRADEQGRWTYLNPAWENLTGYAVVETVNRSVFEHVVDEDREALIARLNGLGSGVFESVRHQFRFKTAMGDFRWGEVQARRLDGPGGEMIGSAGIIVDISDRLALSALADDARRRAERDAEAAILMAATDELTGIASRRAFLAMLEQRLEEGGPLAVALFDIDHFKLVNDRHGHGVGDEVLARIARIADGCVREGDLAGRLGGEEFAVLMTGATLDQAVAMGERLRRACAETVHPPGLSVTVSVGVAAARPGSTSASLLRDADDALYRAKFEGRNCLRRAA